MNRDVLRIIDANANRAREALRVVEDYARFVLDDAQLCAELKQLRHDLVESLRAIVGDAIVHRDTPGDVGTSVKTASETRAQTSRRSLPPPANGWVRRCGRSESSQRRLMRAWRHTSNRSATAFTTLSAASR
jgi:hypothetical protein